MGTNYDAATAPRSPPLKGELIHDKRVTFCAASPLSLMERRPAALTDI